MSDFYLYEDDRIAAKIPVNMKRIQKSDDSWLFTAENTSDRSHIVFAQSITKATGIAVQAFMRQLKRGNQSKEWLGVEMTTFVRSSPSILGGREILDKGYNVLNGDITLGYKAILPVTGQMVALKISGRRDENEFSRICGEIACSIHLKD